MNGIDPLDSTVNEIERQLAKAKEMEREGERCREYAGRLLFNLHQREAGQGVKWEQWLERKFKRSYEDAAEAMERFKTKQWLASRKAAGVAVDIETCNISTTYGYLIDPYGVDPSAKSCIGGLIFVSSEVTDGEVEECDLPLEKQKALRARIRREDLS